MSVKALEVLQKSNNENGFYLMIEGKHNFSYVSKFLQNYLRLSVPICTSYLWDAKSNKIRILIQVVTSISLNTRTKWIWPLKNSPSSPIPSRRYDRITVVQLSIDLFPDPWNGRRGHTDRRDCWSVWLIEGWKSIDKWQITDTPSLCLDTCTNTIPSLVGPWFHLNK